MTNLLKSKNTLYYAIAAIAVIVLVLLFAGSKPATPAANNAIVSAIPSASASVVPSAAACANGELKEFECIGSISGMQTYYECVNGAWESRSRYNYSECVKTFGPNETANWTETPSDTNASATVAPSSPGFVNASISAIRTSTAELEWFTNANATGSVTYGTEKGVRRWKLDAQTPAFSQYKHLLLSPGTTYYFEVQMCANSTCVTTPTLNFTTPTKDTYFVGDTTVPYPGDAVNFAAAQLNAG